MSFKIPNRCPQCNQVVVLCGQWRVITKADIYERLVENNFALECDECSAVILEVSADEIAKRLTDGQTWL